MKAKLRTRLQRLQRTGELTPARPAAEPPENKGNPEKTFLFPEQERLEQTPAGRCYLRELSFSLDRRHGNYTLERCLDCRGSNLSLPARDRSLRAIEPERCLFLDVETTGLSGGTGTWVFLIGLGWLSRDGFRIRQYFLRHPAEERAMLHHFAEFAASFDGLVTFNGKAFDLPLIQTRQTLQKMPQTVPGEHLDLLICARSLWRKRFPSRRLTFLEKALLGFRRRDDIPGEEIPEVYFSYLRRGESSRLPKVFEHNVFDILSMVGLLGRIAFTIALEKPSHPAECYSLGRLYQEAGHIEKAQGYYRQVAGGGALERAALLQRAQLHKRHGEWTGATALWRELARRENNHPEACVELAKYYEHRVCDFQKALHWSERALAGSHRRINICFSSPLHPAALQHRINRLNAKIERQGRSPAPGSAD